MEQIEFTVGLRCPFDGLVEVVVIAPDERDAMAKARHLKPGSTVRFVREAGA